MSAFKLLLPFIIEFIFGHKQTGVGTELQIINLVTGVVKKELSSMILKIAAALVATSILIYSLITLFQYLHAYMLIWENGPIFAVTFFSVLSIACLLLVYKLFGQKEPVKQIFEKNKSVGDSLGFDKILGNFLDGLATGVVQAQEQHDNIKREQEVVRAEAEKRRAAEDLKNYTESLNNTKENSREYSNNYTGIA